MATTTTRRRRLVGLVVSLLSLALLSLMNMVRAHGQSASTPPVPHEPPPPPPTAAAAGGKGLGHRDRLADVLELSHRVRRALEPFRVRRGSHTPPDGGFCYGPPVASSFLAGCPSAGCTVHATQAEAEQACSTTADCAGLTRSASGQFELRASAEPQPSTFGESAYPQRPCRTGASPPKTARNVLSAFFAAVEAGLSDPALHLAGAESLAASAPPREDGSIFVAISAYRDATCGPTVRRAFARADEPSRVHVGVVQHRCEADCMGATGWAETRRVVPQPYADEDCVRHFCASAEGLAHCAAGRVSILRLSEEDSFGPFFSRFLGSHLWRGETFFLQIDAHSDFRRGWDTTLVEMMHATRGPPAKTPTRLWMGRARLSRTRMAAARVSRARGPHQPQPHSPRGAKAEPCSRVVPAATYPNSIISNYPPSGTPNDKDEWPRAHSGDVGAAPALCACSFERVPDAVPTRGRYTVRLAQTSGGEASRSTAPRPSAFIAAGFFVAHASFLATVPFDPFMPFLFMGEEIALSLRFWTAGFDIYAPSTAIVAHEYVRQHSIKFWESVQLTYGSGTLYNELNNLTIQRVQHLVGFPEAALPSQLEPAMLHTQMEGFGPGKRRSREDFLQRMGLDVVRKVQRPPPWCNQPIETG